MAFTTTIGYQIEVYAINVDGSAQTGSRLAPPSTPYPNGVARRLPDLTG